jgi:hypothetical protein
MRPTINFTEEQVEVIYEAVNHYQKNLGSKHPTYWVCEEVLNRAYPAVTAKRIRQNAICDT